MRRTRSDSRNVGILSALRDQVLVFVQCFDEVVGHRNVACPKAILPGDGEPTVQGAIPVNENGVQNVSVPGLGGRNFLCRRT